MMASVSIIPSRSMPPEASALRDAFFRWQCRVRQMAMRDAQGRPNDAMVPAVHRLQDDGEAFGHVITVISKSLAHSVLPELKHMGKSTMDPAQRRDKALTFFSSAYYQKHREFDETLCASFLPGSAGASDILKASPVRLVFDAFNQQFDLRCKVRQLTDQHPLYQATWWHNFLFNPQLSPDALILAFVVDWTDSSANPPIAGGRR